MIAVVTWDFEGMRDAVPGPMPHHNGRGHHPHDPRGTRRDRDLADEEPYERSWRNDPYAERERIFGEYPYDRGYANRNPDFDRMGGRDEQFPYRGERDRDTGVWIYSQHGPSPGASPQALRGPHRGKGPATFRHSDERIREMACEALTDHDEVDATDVEVSVHAGEVTLAGTVEDRRTKRLAEECVERVRGVRDVQNLLRIDDRRSRP